MKKQLFTNAISGITEALAAVATTLMITPFLIEKLGADRYGLFLLILSIIGFFTVFSLGLPAAIQRSLAIYIAKNEDENVNKVFACGLVLFVGIGILASITMIILGMNAYIFNVTEVSSLSIALMFLSIKVFLDFFMLAFHGFFSALLRFDIDFNISAAGEILKAVLLYFLVEDLQLNGAICAVFLTDIFTYGLKLFFAKKIYPKMHFKLIYVTAEEITKLFNYGKHVIAMSLARVIHTKSSPIIITQLFDLQSVVLFNIPSRLCAYAATFSAAVMNNFLPVFHQKFAKNDDLRIFFKDVININVFISCFFYLPFIIMCDTFISLWIGEEFSKTYSIVFLLTFSLLCQAFSKPIQDLLFAQENHQLFTYVNLFGAFTNIILSIIFSHFFGLEGVAAGYAAGFFLTDIILYFNLLKKYNDIPLRPIYTKFFLAVIFLFGIGIAMNALIRHFSINNWPEFIFVSAVVALISLLLSWFLLLDKKMQKAISGVILNRLNFQKKSPPLE